jgi:hypothetical protein
MTKFGKALTAAALAAVLTSSQAMAADNAPLAPGKPAGLQAAQLGTGTTVLLLAGAAIVIAIAIVTSNSGGAAGQPCGSSNCSAPTSTRQ